jgi:hypothetical protein
MNDISTKYLFSPNLSCASDRKRPKDLEINYFTFTNSPIELNRILSDLLPIYFNLPHATNTIEEIKYIREINDIFTNRISGRSTELPSPNH